MSQQAGTGPLSGYRVLDLTQVAAGPFCASLLGDMGADVIKVEPLAGEAFRNLDSAFGPGASGYFFGVNRSKRAIAIDLSRPEGYDLLTDLVRRADVVMQAFRPGAARRLRVDADSIHAIRADVIHCSISAFGSSGPYVDLPGMDILIQALSGTMSITGEPDAPPVRCGPAISDFMAAYACGFAISSALLARQRDGRGRSIELSLLDCLMAGMSNLIAPHLRTGAQPAKSGSGHPQIVPYQAFLASDGYVVIACLSDTFWPPLCAALGRPDWLTDPRFATNEVRVLNRAVLIPLVEELVAGRSRDDLVKALRDHDVPCAPVGMLADAVRDPQIEANRTIRTLDHPVYGAYGVVASPIRMSPDDIEPARYAPGLGEHTGEVLRELGLSAGRIAELTRDGVVGGPGLPGT